MGPMRVLGIDPGTVRMGYGLVEERDGPILLDCGVLEAAAKDPIGKRLLGLHRQLLALVRRHQPSMMAVEESFVVRAPRRAATAVGEARAVALMVAAETDVPVFQYTPTHVRQTVANYGGSDKEQVRQMVGLLLGRSVDGLSLDASDALAVAICHLREAALGALMNEQGPPETAKRKRRK